MEGLQFIEFVLFFEPAAPRFFQVHFKDVDVRQPEVAVDPEADQPVAQGSDRIGRAVGVENDDPLAMGLDIFEGFQGHFIIGNGHTNKHVGIEQAFEVFWHDGVHEAGLFFKAVVLVHEGELDNIALVGLIADIPGFDVGVGGQYVQDAFKIPLPDMRNRPDRSAGIEQARKADGRMRGTAIFLDHFALVRGNMIAGDGSEHSYFE